jgi:hypothetical protein
MAAKVQKIRNIQFGADPELFLIQEGRYISSIGRVGGTKLHPRDIGNGSAVQEDNVAIEFNTKPAASKEDFIRSLQAPLTYLKTYAKDALNGMELAIVPSALFPPEELLNPKAMVFGCEPDYNAWTRQVNPRPVAPKGLERLRTCGGHLHVSWDEPDTEDAVQLVRAMDLFIGAPSIFHDKDQQRRKLYGCAGAFRVKPYGVEYRTLSNWWIADTAKMEWVYDHAQQAIKFVNAGRPIDKKTEALIHQAINHGNEKSAKQLVKQFRIDV